MVKQCSGILQWHGFPVNMRQPFLLGRSLSSIYICFIASLLVVFSHSLAIGWLAVFLRIAPSMKDVLTILASFSDHNCQNSTKMLVRRRYNADSVSVIQTQDEHETFLDASLSSVLCKGKETDTLVLTTLRVFVFRPWREPSIFNQKFNQAYLQ